jgi:prepilin-type N-terminal cleavage/methylation domain-containing protein
MKRMKLSITHSTLCLPVKPAGFTLVELMVVIAIVSIMFATIVPSVGVMISNGRAETLALELESDIMFARNQARSHAEEIRVLPMNGSWSTGWTVSSIDGDGNQTDYRVKGSIAEPIAEPGEVTSSYSSASPLVIDARGRLSDTGDFTIEVNGCQGEHVRTIELNFIGQLIVTLSEC